MPLILVATQDGLHTFDVAGRRGVIHLPGRAVTTIAPDREELWALLDGSEVWHASDIDRWSQLVTLDHYRGTCIAATADDVFVGRRQQHDHCRPRPKGEEPPRRFRVEQLGRVPLAGQLAHALARPRQLRLGVDGLEIAGLTELDVEPFITLKARSGYRAAASARSRTGGHSRDG
jgi:hypothetical protein